MWCKHPRLHCGGQVRGLHHNRSNIGEITSGEWRSIHRPPTPLTQRTPASEIFTSGIKAIDVRAPLERGGKAGLFGGAGAEVQRTGRILDIPVGAALLGRVIAALGRPLDNAGVISASDRRPVERDAPSIEELEALARFGTRLEEKTRKTLERGRRVRAIVQQRQYEPLPVPEQIAAFVAVTGGVLDELPVERLPVAERALRRAVIEQEPTISAHLQAGEKLRDADLESILRVAR